MASEPNVLTKTIGQFADESSGRLTLRDAFVNYLTSMDFPADAIVTESPIYDPSRLGEIHIVANADITIVDPTNRKLIAIIEMGDSDLTPVRAKGLWERFKPLNKHLLHTIPIFFVCRDANKWRITLVMSANRMDTSWQSFPKLNALISARINRGFFRIELEKKQSFNRLQLTSWILATAMAILYILMKTKFLENVSTEEVAVLGGVIGLILIPFGAKIKMLGFEIQGKDTKD